MSAWPAYLELHGTGQLAERARVAVESLRCCELCPRRCRVDRSSGETGACRQGRHAKVANVGPHYGEEAPLVGRGGSGTIFFAGCNLTCSYCQNYDISQFDQGQETSPSALAGSMLELQDSGCENVNLVSPTHVVAQVLEALVIAVDQGLHLPLVYNTGGYESIETLSLLDGLVDIYMPDVKYGDDDTGLLLSGVPDYVIRNREALLEMHAQVGDLVMDTRGVARRGLLVRHLVLPGGLAGTERAMRFVAEEVSRATYVNIMDQYRPEYRARTYPTLDRRPSAAEHTAATDAATGAGLYRFDGLD